MTADRRTLCVQITRGLAPAITIANTVSACRMFDMDYKLLSGRPAREAKQEAAQTAVDQGRDLLLIEDDVMPDQSSWDAVRDNRDDVLIATALMRNGMLNTWFHGPRVLYSGSVFLRVPLPILTALGSPWFDCRDLEFNGNLEEWRDKGANDQGEHSDVYFFYRCWQLGIMPVVAGFAVHYLHQGNATSSDLQHPSDIRPMGMMDCTKATKTRRADHE